MRDLIYTALDTLDMFVEFGSDFFGWLFTEIDGGILGTIAPIELLSFGTIISFLIARIILSINQ